MSEINILSPHVADLIAAGEVVERPASVIKELIENSFDAGAQNVICEIRNGGTTYIRVTNDGCGMAPEDAGIAFLRHATSKLKTETDLEGIGTMGFRGEALAAISSVSRVELVTRQAPAAEGVRVTLEAGDICDMEACGCPQGTTMIIRDLFYNTPARQKFMKTDRSESSACVAAALRCALARPDVSVRMIRDGEDDFFSPGDGRIDSCLYSLLGREESASMLQCSSSSEHMRLNGYISSPSDCRGNRAHQFFFVNGRFIRSQLLQTAVEQAYKNSLLPGRYPSCALYLELPLGTVDVNVHPAKTEIRFGAEKTVFDFIFHAVCFALETEDRLSPARPVSSVFREDLPSGKKSAPAAPVYSSQIGSAVRTAGIASAVNPGSAESSADGVSSADMAPGIPDCSVSERYRSGSGTASVSAAGTFSVPNSTRQSYSPYDEDAVRQAHPAASLFSSVQNIQIGNNDSIPAVSLNCAEKNVQNSVQNVESSVVPPHKILGEAFRTYIIVEQNSEILLIDKHAAHERMIFDRLKNSVSEISTQLLLAPETLTLSLEDAELLENNGDLLASLGFEIEPFGERTFIVRGVPADMLSGDAAASIQEICEQLRSGISPDPADTRDKILHTVACKAAIKAGWDTSVPELEKLAAAVLTGEIKYCPHGRPVSAVVTRRDLDKLFKRII